MMKKAIVALLSILVCSLFLVAPAEAKDMTGRLGVGSDTSLGFFFHNEPTPATVNYGQSASKFDFPGLSIVFQISEIVAVQFIGSYQTTTASNASGATQLDYDVTVWATALRGIFATGLTDDVNLGVFGGFALVGRSAAESGVGTFDNSALHLSIETGLRPEWFITNYFSVHTQVGISVSILDEDNSGFSEGGFNINAFQNADLLGDAGFTFWF